MSQARLFDRRSIRLLPGVAAAVLVLAGLLPVLAAEEPAETLPTLPVSAAPPIPESLRKPVPESVEDLRAIETRVRSLVEDLQAVTVGLRRGPAQGPSGPPGPRRRGLGVPGRLQKSASFGATSRSLLV